jgi:type II secretory ATPase GspE/PulE/Tfp pilus assembly ATPase PilB-like protein
MFDKVKTFFGSDEPPPPQKPVTPQQKPVNQGQPVQRTQPPVNNGQQRSTPPQSNTTVSPAQTRQTPPPVEKNVEESSAERTPVKINADDALFKSNLTRPTDSKVVVEVKKIGSDATFSADEEKEFDILLQMGVPPVKIKYAQQRRRMTGEHISVIMRDFSFLGQEDVSMAIAKLNNLPYASKDIIEKIDGPNLLPLKEYVPLYRGYVPISISSDKKEVTVGISDIAMMSEAGNNFRAFNSVKITIASDSTLQTIYRKWFSSTEEDFDIHLNKYLEIMNSRSEDLDSRPGFLRDIIGYLLRHACMMKVSDIHMHMTEAVGLIKFTIDGESRIFRSIPKDLYNRIIQKVISDARVKHEDLRNGMKEGTVEFDNEEDKKAFSDVFSRYGFRLQLGDAKGAVSAVIRILDRQSNVAELKNLNFDPKTLSTLNRYTNSATGLIIVTGPTGSGKTTTLYAALKEIDPVSRSIQTIENPVEYRHGLWMQYEISRTAKSENEGGEWAKMLKGLLRNAPKVILMGEVRDADTAKTLIDASNTGHLVFTTLHTNTASSAIARLKKMEVDLDSLASELLGVLAQRLIRTLCPKCKIEDDNNIETKELLLNDDNSTFLSALNRQMGPTLFKSNHEGCPYCNYTGYSGRRSIYELLDVTPKVRALIENGASTSKIAAEGIKKGYSMWDCGLKLVYTGQTDMQALRSVASPEVTEE